MIKEASNISICKEHGCFYILIYCNGSSDAVVEDIGILSANLLNNLSL